MANVAGDDLLLLQGLRNAECVVDHRLLDRVHLREGKRRRIREEQNIGSLRFLCSRAASPQRGGQTAKIQSDLHEGSSITPENRTATGARWTEESDHLL